MSSVRDWAFLRMRTELTSKRILLIFDELSPVRGWTFSKNEKRKTLVFLGLTQSHIRHAFSPRGQCEAGCAAQARPFRPLITTAVCYQCKGPFTFGKTAFSTVFFGWKCTSLQFIAFGSSKVSTARLYIKLLRSKQPTGGPVCSDPYKLMR